MHDIEPSGDRYHWERYHSLHEYQTASRSYFVIVGTWWEQLGAISSFGNLQTGSFTGAPDYPGGGWRG